jgi:hypothetical protein
LNQPDERTGEGAAARRSHPPSFILHSSVALLFILLSVAFTWPLAVNLDRAAADPEDPFLNTFILHWDYRGTFSDPLALFHAPIFHPARYALAFSENLYGIAVFFFPLFAAGVPPLAVYNIAVIAGFALSGWAAFLLARSLSGSTGAAIVAGLFFAFLPYRFTQLTHLQHVWSMWLPLLLLALIRFHRAPGWKNAVLFGVAFLFNGLSNIHWLVFGSFAAGVSGFFLALTSERWREWMKLVAATAVAGVLLLPFLLPYVRASEMYGMKRQEGEVRAHSATLSDWILIGGRTRLYDASRGAFRENHELNLGFGITALLLCGAGALLTSRRSRSLEAHGVRRTVTDASVALPERQASRVALRTIDVLLVLTAALAYVAATHAVFDAGFLRMRDASVPAMLFALLLLARLWVTGIAPSFLARSRFSIESWAAFLWIPMGIVGSFGMNAFFHQFLYARIPVFASIRVPARWSMIAYAGISVLIAFGVVALRERFARSAPARRLAAVGTPVFAGAILLLELNTVPVRWWPVDPRHPQVYQWLRNAPISGAVFELPMEMGSDEYGYLLRQTHHGKPLVNGVSGFFPRHVEELAWLLGRTPIDDRLLDRLQQYGCSTIVVHADRLFDRTPAVRDWLRLELRRGRLVFLRRLDHGIEGDYVFAVARREPNIALLRDPPDGEALNAFLEGRRTYNETTFGVLEEPKGGSWIDGPLTVSGWALSPEGIVEVNLLFGSGRIRVPAELHPRPKLTTEVFPWYSNVERPAFRKTFDTPLRGLPRDTDLQVEVVDGSGRRTYLDAAWFTWRAEDRNERREWRPKRRVIHPSSWRAAELDALLVSLGADPALERPRIVDGRSSIAGYAHQWRERHNGLTDAQFIDRAYEILLKRPSEPAGKTFYLRQLGRGASRADIVDAMIASDEFAHAHGISSSEP